MMLVLACGVMSAAAHPAQAQITNLTAGDPSTDTPEGAFTDDMGLEAIGESTVRGGTLCVVDAGVSDPGDGSLNCKNPALGGSQAHVGLGSFFMPLVDPNAMKDGVYRLLGDGAFDDTEPDDLSSTFSVSPCDACDPAPVEAMFQDWKDANKPLAASSGTACTLLDLQEKAKNGEAQYKLASGVAKDALGSEPDFWAVAGGVGEFAFGDFAPDALESGLLDQYVSLLHELTCRTKEMYKDIVADPPDPNYTVQDNPVFGAAPPVADPATRQLSLLLDQIRASGAAELTAVQRFEGAQAANDSQWMGTQAALVATDGQAMSDEMEAASQQLTSYAATLQADGVGTSPLPQSALDAAQAFEQQIHDNGFTQQQTDEMNAAGLDSTDQSDLAAAWGSEPLDSNAVGKTLQQGLDAFASDLDNESAAEAAFAQSFADYAPRTQPAQLTATITDASQGLTLAPSTEHFSGADSRPGSSPITSYHWDFGDGTSDDGVETSHEYDTPGSYTVTLTVTDGNGQTSSASQNVSVEGRDQLLLPVCDDGVTGHCPGFDALQPGSAFTVAGTGNQDVQVKYVHNDSDYVSSVVWFPVDDAAGTIDGLFPGQPGWIEAAESRMQVAFGTNEQIGDTLTLHLHGGEHFSLALAPNSDLARSLQYNPLNLPAAGTPGFQFQFAGANEYGTDHVMPYLRTSDGMMQIGFEDGGGDLDYSDNIYDVSGVTPSMPGALSTTVAADQAEVTPGANDGYEVKLHNSADATTVLDFISDTLPNGFSYVPGSTRGATTSDPSISGQTLTWHGRFTAPGDGVAGLHFSVRAADAAGKYFDQGTADAGGAPVTSSGASAEVDVTSSPVFYPLSVTLTGSGAGAVTGSPGNIRCGTTCSDTFSSGTPITLTATPAGGSMFGGWSGACTGTAETCTVTVSQARTVSAEFDRIGGAAVPVDTIAPRISGTAAVRQALACSPGTWTNSPTGYTYQWNRFGLPIAGASSSSYRVAALDAGAPLTCRVVASNAAGPGNAATSSSVVVALPHVRGCPPATGAVAGARVGLAELGMTRARARRAYAHSTTRGYRYADFFCLTPIGVRVGYASPHLLTGASRSRRRQLAGRVVWISTSNPYYALAGIRPGSSLAAAQTAVSRGSLFHVGMNDWYLGAHGSVTAIFKVRRNVIEEVGIAARSVTGSASAERVFLHSFS